MIYVDGRGMNGQSAGVGRYVRQLIEHWPTADLTVLNDVRLKSVKNPVVREEFIGRRASFHLRAARRASKAQYWSPESLIVPSLADGTVLTVHDLTPLSSPDHHARRNLIFHKLLLGTATKRARCVVVPSRYVALDVAKRLPHLRGRIHVIPEGFSFSPPPDFGPRENRILYVGTIEPRKNVISLLEAFRSLPDGGWTLDIVGKMGWLNESDRAKFAHLVDDPRVTWHKWVPDRTVQKLLSSSAILVYPSNDEGFGLPVLEGLAAGCAVITTDAPALVELAAGAAVHVHRSTLRDGLTASLAEVMESAELRRSLSVMGLARAKHFSWAESAKAMREVILGERSADA